MTNRLGRACTILGTAGTLAMSCSRAPTATQTDVTELAAADGGAAVADPPEAAAAPAEAADARAASGPLDVLAPTGPILRERATVDVDGVAESWRLEWNEPPTPECATLEQFAMSCSCWGFTIAETGPLDLVRSRPNMPDERLALSPLFVGDRTRAILQRWKLGAHEPFPDDLGYLGMFRPAVTVMNLGDYDHDGRSTEFVLQIVASACFDVAVVVGISKSNPHLHVFGSAESPQTQVALFHRDQWEKLRTSPTIDAVQLACGERGMGWGDAPDGGARCDLPDSELRIRADGEFHVRTRVAAVAGGSLAWTRIASGSRRRNSGGPGGVRVSPACYSRLQERQMDEWILANPGVLGGKPCIRGTRISVEFILELLASGASREDILRSYPQVTSDGLAAALAFAARSMKNDIVWDLQIPT